ncbi:MAG: hypothetical protein JW929_06295 [Anaerolineales bacterium]|nr:hypothetical protein [Anaerolineales bacterium]
MAKSQAKQTGSSASSWRGSEALITLGLLIFGILCQLPVLTDRFPGLDDSGYLFDGVRLVEQGALMPLGSGPLSGILNGILYLFFPRDHMLLGYVSMIRRVLLLVGIMAASGIAGRAVGGRGCGWAAMAITAFARPVTTALMVTADSLYSALAGLAFAVLIAGWIPERQGVRRISGARWTAAGLLIGFSALARLDGVILGSALVLCVWFFRGRNKPAARDSLAFGVAFLGPVLAYFLLFGIVRGSWDPQIGQRSYLAFEQGHNFLYTDRYEVIPSPSSADLYGTAEENGNSVLRAIARNPGAFLARLPRTAANAMRMFNDAYSILGGAMFLFLAAGGALALWNGEKRAVCGLAALWCLPLLGYGLASYRPGFFAMLFPVLLAVAAGGAVAAVPRWKALIQSDQASPAAVWTLAALAMLSAQAAFAKDQYGAWGARREMEEQYQAWLTELSEQVPRGECVIAYNAADAVYSNHEVYGHWQLFYEAGDAEALRRAMREAGCRYLVVDDSLRSLAPDFVPIAEGALEEVYVSRDGSRTVLILES